MNANLIKVIAGIIMVALTMTVSTIETIGGFGTCLYVAAMILCLLVIGVDFKITKEKPEDWDGA